MRATAYDADGQHVADRFEFTHEENAEALMLWVRKEWPAWSDVPIEFGDMDCSWG